MKRDIFVFDLDGTLSELWDSANPYNHDWEEASIHWMELLYNYVEEHSNCIILTWRKRKEYWVITEKWLEFNEISYLELIMQEWSQAEKNHIYKEKELIKLQERYNIVAMVDDNPDLIPVCKKLWILLLQVHR